MAVQTTQHKKIWNNYLTKFKLKLSNYKIKSFESNYSAVIMETREHEDLETVIKNVMYFLNESNSNIKWKLEIFHGNLNKEYVENIVSGVDNVVLHQIDYDSMGLVEYDSIFRDVSFWERITSENILIFQTDSILLRSGIDEFLEYSYIGAPWLKPKEGKFVGNGGLSFRKKKDMIDTITQFPNDSYFKEDIYFCKYLESKVPDIGIAKQFSVEDLEYDNPLGVHQPKVEYGLLEKILKNGLNNIQYE